MVGNADRRWRSPRREERTEGQRLLRRFSASRLVALLLFAALTVQLVHLQLLKGDDYRRRAESNRLAVEALIPARGILSDRNGQPLVANEPEFSAVVVPADLPSQQRRQVIFELGAILGVPPGQIDRRLRDAAEAEDYNPFVPILVKQDLSEEEALVLREAQPRLPGARLQVNSTRRYLAGQPMAQILGYVGAISPEELKALQDEGYQLDDRIGRSGIERVYERLLRGDPGRQLVERNAAGVELGVFDEEPPEDGMTIILAIDLALQQRATQAVQAAMAEEGAIVGAAVVLDVRTGEVLALVSEPSYDNNAFSEGITEAQYAALERNPGRPLINHAIGDQFAPGSAFKVVTALAALQEGVAGPGTTISSSGRLLIHNENNPEQVIATFRDAARGTFAFYEGVARSSNIYFACLAIGGFELVEPRCPLEEGLGPARLATYARALGLGQPTGIELPGELPGLVPEPDAEGSLDQWYSDNVRAAEKWRLGSTLNFAIGQEVVEATPIQMAVLTAAIANGGRLLQPRVVREIRDAQGSVVVPFQTVVRGQLPIDPENLAALREGMRQAVEYGTATRAQVRGHTVAGKTGTPEVGTVRDRDGKLRTHSWFLGFAPFEAPQIAVVVYIQAGSGSGTAAPVAQEILDFYFRRTATVQVGGVR